MADTEEHQDPIGVAEGRGFAQAMMHGGPNGPVDLRVITMGNTEAERRLFLVGFAQGIRDHISLMGRLS